MQLDKSEIIQEFIGHSEERFALAADIYANFPNILNQMLASICNHIVIAFNQSYHTTLSRPVKIGTLSNAFYFDSDINSDSFVRVLFSNYFKQTINLRIFHNEQFGDAALFNTNALNDIHTYADVFQVYQNTNGFRDRLVGNCLHVFGEKLTEMIAEVNSEVHAASSVVH